GFPSDFGFRASDLLSWWLQRQADAERAAAPHLALDLDGAAVVADDAEADRQSQPRPLADRLGGEERLEQPRPVLRPDAAAVVLHLDHDAPFSPSPLGGEGLG